VCHFALDSSLREVEWYGPLLIFIRFKGRCGRCRCRS
ncbi:hypothetical protein A2U01_0112943, partial [Trifolium medium]|nr:hypothetical protein [Trifolium medium]